MEHLEENNYVSHGNALVIPHWEAYSSDMLSADCTCMFLTMLDNSTLEKQ